MKRHKAPDGIGTWKYLRQWPTWTDVRAFAAADEAKQDKILLEVKVAVAETSSQLVPNYSTAALAGTAMLMTALVVTHPTTAQDWKYFYWIVGVAVSSALMYMMFILNAARERERATAWLAALENVPREFRTSELKADAAGEAGATSVLVGGSDLTGPYPGPQPPGGLVQDVTD